MLLSQHNEYWIAGFKFVNLGCRWHELLCGPSTHIANTDWIPTICQQKQRKY
jgi:hypothetical protein